MKWLLLAGALLSGASGFAYAETPAPAPAPAAQSAAVPMPAADWLFVQVGDSLTSDGKTLTISGIAPQTTMFSDRPERMTGDASTAKFVEFWTKGKDDFQKDPPNATISMMVDGKPRTVVVELLNPKLDGDNLTYEIRPLDGDMPASAQDVSLFIDWWYGPGWHHEWIWPGPGPYPGGECWRGPWGHLHCRPWWAY